MNLPGPKKMADDIALWARALPAWVVTIAKTITGITTIVGVLLIAFHAVAAQAGLPDTVASQGARLTRVEVRVDSLLRITTQTFCLQRAQAQRTDWTECVK